MDIFLIFLCLLFGGITAAVAQSKGREPLPWFLFGAVLFIVALIVVILLPPGTGSRHSARRACPYCGARLAAGQMNCPNCNRAQPNIGAATESSWQKTLAVDDDVAKWAKQNAVRVTAVKSPSPPAGIHFECPQCAQRMTGDESLRSNHVECPACGEKFIPRPTNPA